MKKDIYTVNVDNSTLFVQKEMNDEKANTQIVVPPTHTAFLIKDGKLLNTFEEGKYDISEKTRGAWIFKHKVKDFDTLTVLYISKTAKVPVYWGTAPSNPIEYIDSKLGYPIKLKAGGSLEVKVADPKKFYLEIVASSGNDTLADTEGKTDMYSVEKFQNRFRPKATSVIKDIVKKTIIEKEVSYFDLDTYKTQIEKELLTQLKANFLADYGIEVCDFLIEKFTIDEEEKQTLISIYQEKKRRENYRDQRGFDQEVRADQEADVKHALEFKRSLLDDENALYEDQKRKERDEIEYKLRIERENEDRAWARERSEKLDQKEIELNKIYHETVRTVGWEHSPIAKKDNSQKGSFCTSCGAEIGKDDKFCGNCGAPTKANDLKDTCPKCGREISIKVLYCPSCGTKLKEDSKKK